jgi:hypothetical protein
MRHAALRVHGQPMIWQQVFINIESIAWTPLCQRRSARSFRCVILKKVIKEVCHYCCFEGTAGLAAAGAFAAAPGGSINIVVLMESSLSKSLSR